MEQHGLNYIIAAQYFCNQTNIIQLSYSYSHWTTRGALVLSHSINGYSYAIYRNKLLWSSYRSKCTQKNMRPTQHAIQFTHLGIYLYAHSLQKRWRAQSSHTIYQVFIRSSSFLHRLHQ